MRLILLYLSLLILFLPGRVKAQRVYTIKKINEEVKMDGILDEPFWQSQKLIESFTNQWPVDSGLAKVQTSVRMAFDDQFLYLGVICYDISNNHIIRTLKRDRDDEYFGSDGLGVVLDPNNKKSNGFFFGVNAGGAQIEGLIRVNESQTILDPNWDSKWYSEISKGDSVWYIEFAIPFRTLRYNPENTTWGINFVRNDMKTNSYSSWNRVPVNLNTIDLGYTGSLNWESGPPKIKNGAINLIPYLSGSLTRDYEAGAKIDLGGNAGVDAKVALSSSLNLDITFNPDFSTVDVDVQQTNLTRFSLFFPERRGFFLENSDLFTSFGLGSINPFFSRRIGLANGEAVPIVFGFRLTGNLSQKVRIGLMDVQTGAITGANPQNYGVAAVQYRIGQRSSLNGLFVNRQRINKNEDQLENSFNRVGAFELNLLSNDGKWAADLGAEKSFNPVNLEEEEYYSTTLRHNSKNMFAKLTAHKVGRDFLADVGFVPRLNNYDASRDTTVRIGFYQIEYSIGYDFYPDSKLINLHGPRLSSTIILNPDGSFSSTFTGLYYYFNFKDQSAFEINVTRSTDNLPFDSFIVGDEPFPKQNYKYSDIGFFYNTDPRKKLSSSLSARYGNFYSGKRLSTDIRLGYRVQPWGNFGISYSLNQITLPDPFQSSTLHLTGITSEISFSNKMFWTTFLQYNTQIKNLNINSRFQWRYRPMSDLFVVYTENYVSQDLKTKNRGLVIKLTFWI